MHGKTIKRFTLQVPWQGSRLLPPQPEGAGGTVVCGQTVVARKKIQNKVEIWSLFPLFFRCRQRGSSPGTARRRCWVRVLEAISWSFLLL